MTSSFITPGLWFEPQSENLDGWPPVRCLDSTCSALTQLIQTFWKISGGKNISSRGLAKTLLTKQMYPPRHEDDLGMGAGARKLVNLFPDNNSESAASPCTTSDRFPPLHSPPLLLFWNHIIYCFSETPKYFRKHLFASTFVIQTVTSTGNKWQKEKRLQ